jgi:hypothetical protein
MTICFDVSGLVSFFSVGIASEVVLYGEKGSLDDWTNVTAFVLMNQESANSTFACDALLLLAPGDDHNNR